MRLHEIYEGVGRITKQNQTADVGPNEVTTQAAKFGNKVDRDGKPPLLNSKARKNTTPNKAWNLGIAENCYTNSELAIMEGGHDLNDLYE